MNQPIAGATTILSPLQILNNPDLPVTGTDYVQGGDRSAATLDERDAIPVALRKRNVTKCYVEADQTTYVLRGGITNDKWVPFQSSTAQVGGNGSGKHLAKFLDALSFTLGVAVNVLIPADLFGAAPVAFDSLAVQGLPPGVTFSSGGTNKLTGMPTALGSGTILINAALQTGEKLQYAWAYTTSAVPVSPSVGDIPVDISFGSDTQANSNTLLYDYSLVLALNEPGMAEHGQRATPGVSGRWIGDNTVAGCLGIAPIAKQVVGGGIYFYRFAMSVAKLRELYPAKQTVRFDFLGKRNAGNADGTNNQVAFRIGRDLSGGLMAGPAPIGFQPVVPTPGAVPVDYNNNGQGYGVLVAETLLAYLTITLSDGSFVFTAVAGPPQAAAAANNTTGTQLVGGPYDATIAQGTTQLVGGPYEATINP